MANLTLTALYTKKFFFGFLLFLGGLVVLLIFFNLGQSAMNMFFPPKPAPALVAFGKLPKINLDEGIKPASDITYKIETVSGGLKELGAQLKVFAIGSPNAKFGDLEGANFRAEGLQFDIPPIGVIGGVATYGNKRDRSKTLEIELTSGNTIINSDYLNNQQLITSQPKDDASSLLLTKKFLDTVGIKNIEYPSSKVEHIKYKIDDGKLTESFSLSGANLVQVNFNRADIDGVGVVYSNYRKPKIRILVSKDSVVAAKANITKIQEFKFSTYPLRGVQSAFSDLKNGGAMFNKKFDGKEFAIRDVKLAYLDTDSTQQYLQPVYVFESDEGLAAYVVAVDGTWLK
ncbi:MAG: hypothetical protein AAB512_00070 [Patescibacteria group bacterium]